MFYARAKTSKPMGELAENVDTISKQGLDTEAGKLTKSYDTRMTLLSLYVITYPYKGYCVIPPCARAATTARDAWAQV